MQKTCTRCLVLKNISEFRKDNRLKSGIGAICVECSRAKALEWRAKNLDRAKASFKAWAQKNKSKNSARKMQWAKENPENKKNADKKYALKNREKIKQTRRKYMEANKEKIKEKVKEWRVRNIVYVLSKNAFRRASQLNRTPSWLTMEDREKMDNIYKECREISKQTGIPHHVDHIFPLLGQTVSGLHVPWNLQILTATENIRKRNRSPE